MTDDARLAACDELHRALARLPGWRRSKSVLWAEVGLWHAVAYDGRRLGRGRYHEALEAVEPSEAEAVAALARMLDARADDVDGS
jgi:hypothetical protein